jgi:hypothetical protein
MVDSSPATWVREGGTWSYVGLLGDPSVPGRSVAAVTAAPHGGPYLAVGRQTGIGDVQTPLAWSSTDGRTWRTVGVAAGGETGLVDTFVGRDGGLIAIGNRVERKRTTPTVYVLRGAVLTPQR